MFIKQDNTLKWDWILVAAVITMVLVVAGVLWFDVPLYFFMHQFDYRFWEFIGQFFGSDIWVYVSMPVFLITAILKHRAERGDQIINGTSRKIKVSFFASIWNFISHLKTNLKKMVVWLRFNDPMQKKRSYRIVSALSRVSFLVLCAVILQSIIVGPLKVILGRMRPIFLESFGDYGFVPFTIEWVFNSMPSGHTAASFAGLVSIGMFFPRLKFITWSIAILVGISRICTGAHFPADVILGAFIGMLAADIVKSVTSISNQ